MTDSERISELENYFKLSTRALAVAINLKNPQTLYDIHKGKHGISKDLAEKITAKYLNIDKFWLLTGEGEMLKSNPESTSVENEDPSTKIFLGIIETLTATNMELTMANKELVNSNTRMAQQIQEMQNILHEMEEDMETLRREFQRGLASMGSADAEAV